MCLLSGQNGIQSWTVCLQSLPPYLLYSIASLITDTHTALSDL